jgi:hypothetical protein
MTSQQNSGKCQDLSLMGWNPPLWFDSCKKYSESNPGSEPEMESYIFNTTTERTKRLYVSTLKSKAWLTPCPNHWSPDLVNKMTANTSIRKY